MTAVAVDLGGTFLRCAVASESGQVSDLVSFRIDGDPRNREPEKLWNRIFDAIEKFAADAHAGLNPEDPIAIAFPGPIVDHASIIGAPTVAGNAAAMPDVVGH